MTLHKFDDDDDDDDDYYYFLTLGKYDPEGVKKLQIIQNGYDQSAGAVKGRLFIIIMTVITTACSHHCGSLVAGG